MKKRFKALSAGLSFLFLVGVLPGCTSPEAAPATSLTATSTVSTTPATAPASQLQWLGHSAFLVTSSQGTKVLIDPVNASTGYTIAPISGVDVVLVTHEHGDHSNVGMATGSPLILRGLNSSGWNTIDETVKGVHIFSISPAVPVYHDNQQGASRGRNTIFVMEVDGIRLAHVGDLGHVMTPEMVKAIGPLDALIVPVGGSYTIDASMATQVVSQLNPRAVIPMHYKTPKMSANWPGVGVDAFLEGKKVERTNSPTIKLSKSTLPAQTTVFVLNYE